jgi:high-affinity Fe2+/Pb2+ permease
MKKIFRAIPFILVLGQIFYYTISGWNQLNGIKIIGYILGLLIAIYFLFIVTTEKYIDFRDNFKIKKVRMDTDSSSLDNNYKK